MLEVSWMVKKNNAQVLKQIDRNNLQVATMTRTVWPCNEK